MNWIYFSSEFRMCWSRVKNTFCGLWRFQGFVNWQQLVDNTPRLYSSQMQLHFWLLETLKIVPSWKYQVKAWTALQTWLQSQCVRHINAASTRACPVVWRMRMSHRLWALNFGAALLWLALPLIGRSWGSLKGMEQDLHCELHGDFNVTFKRFLPWPWLSVHEIFLENSYPPRQKKT